MLLNHHIITPGNSKPCLGFVQDCMTSMYLLTADETTVPIDVAMQLYNTLKYPQQPFPESTSIGSIYTGKELFSCLLPRHLTVKCKDIVIDNGKLISGQLSDKVLGTSSNGLIHILSRWPMHDEWNIADSLEYTQRFISDAQRMGIAYLSYRGFTVGIRDCIISDTMRKDIMRNLEEGIQLAKDVYISPVPTTSKQIEAVAKSKQELNVLARLDHATTSSGSLVCQKIATPMMSNNINIMLQSGAKGKTSNIMQMSACVGQQIINGQRPLAAFALSQRTLPFYTEKQSIEDPRARGFIKESFVQGLSVTSFFAAAQGGREGMTDTSVKSVTGDTRMVLYHSNGKKEIVQIGIWIDHLFANRLSESTQTVSNTYEMSNDTSMTETIKLCHGHFWSPTIDRHGNSFYSKISSICRHNSDGILYTIISKSGRKVTVPKSKSLLLWNAEESIFEKQSAANAHVGNLMPTTFNREFPNPLDSNRSITEDSALVMGIFLDVGHIDDDKHRSMSFRMEILENTKINEILCRLLTALDISYRRFNTKISLTGETKKTNLLYSEGKNIFPSQLLDLEKEIIIPILRGFFSSAVIKFRAKYVETTPMNIVFAEGLAQLLCRFGIFTSFKENNDAVTLLIKGDDVQKFYQAFRLFGCPYQNLSNEETDEDENEEEFVRIHDVILDPIVKIEEHVCDIQNTKLYDITVPETNNFTLANNLNVYDTQDTGYFTRRLTKNLENVSVMYDGTVRNDGNEGGQVIQFLYGEDGFDPLYLEHQQLQLYSVSPEQLFASIFDLDFLEDELKQQWYEIMMKTKDNLRALFPYRAEGKWYVPVRISHYIQFSRSLFPLANANMKDFWAKAFVAITSFLDHLRLENSNNQQQLSTCIQIFECLVLENLSPAEIAKHIHSLEQLQWVLASVEKMWKKSFIIPGEKVGVIAAQSIGQLAMQSTLNS